MVMKAELTELNTEIPPFRDKFAWAFPDLLPKISLL
jgi:hypothetical protein